MIKFRKYGKEPYKVILVHGGPGAPGEMAPIAKKLSQKKINVLEPFQSKLNIQELLFELQSIIEIYGKPPFIIVGWSWGAWLSTILTALHPKLVKKLILISSGPFMQKYAEDIMKTRLKRLNNIDRENVKFLLHDHSTATDMQKLEKLISKADSYDTIKHEKEILEYQYNIFVSISMEASFLRNSGKLLDFASKIKSPVVAIHGDYDPHPYKGVQNPLSGVVDNFKFILLEKCGHHPWYEKYAKKEFFEILIKEIKSK